MNLRAALSREERHQRDEFARELPTLSYLAFCKRIGVTLTPGQRTVAAIAYDGVPPEDPELCQRIFGGVFRPSPASRNIVAAVCGRGAGKSYTLCALRLLQLAFTVDLSKMAPGELAVGLIVAPDMRLAGQTLRFAAGAMQRPMLAPYLVSDTATKLVIRRPDGTRAALSCYPATAGGVSVRGKPILGAVLDEAAFFRDESHAVNDVEIFDAILPRLLPGGQIILASSPWMQGGLLYELFSKNYGKPTTAIAAHAPTLLLRDDAQSRAMVAAMEANDPDKARRECGAEFLSAGAGVFFDPRAIQASVTAEAIVPAYGDELIAGADFGFRVNASTLVIGVRRANVTHLVRVVEMRPEADRPLVPSEVVAAFAAVCRELGVDSVIADGHYRESVLEHLTREGLTLMDAPAGAVGKAETHVQARTLFNEGRVRIVDNTRQARTLSNEGRVRIVDNTRLIKQLREIVAVPVSGGTLSIRSPQWSTGEHGDLASAAVLVLSALSGKVVQKVVDYRDRIAAIREETDTMWARYQERHEQRQASARDGFDHGTTTLADDSEFLDTFGGLDE